MKIFSPKLSSLVLTLRKHIWRQPHKVLHEAPPTEKAGGILVRFNERGEQEICLVHRPRHNDWSLPKGHINTDESAVQAAQREVGEETGYKCEIIKELPAYHYVTPHGEQVKVRFFEMRVIASGMIKDEEVDQVQWLTVPRALKLLSYKSLIEYLAIQYTE